MPDWVKVVEAIASQLARVRIMAERCCRVRSPLSRCRRCIEVCSTGGIGFEGEKLSMRQCLDCGLCASVCPTGALSLQQPSEEQLLKTIFRVARIFDIAMIACERTGGARGPSTVVVPCLGALSFELLMYLAAEDNLSVTFLWQERFCKDCSVRKGGEIFQRRLAAVRSAFGAESLPVTARAVRQTRRRALTATHEDRREFFASLANGLKRVTKAALSESLRDAFLKEPQGEEGTHSPLPRTLLFRRHLHLCVAKKSSAANSLPVPTIVGNCFFCGVCRALCPLGAIEQVEKEERVRLVVDVSCCTGCGLCSEVCYYRALAIESKPMTDVTLTLTAGTVQICQECGREWSGNVQSPTCPLCQSQARAHKLLSATG